MTSDIPGLELHEVLGRGAAAVVRRGRRDGRDYAVKTVDTTDDDAIVALRREAALLARLTCADVPRVRDAGRVGSLSYLVTDLVPGRSLRQLLGDGPPAPDRVVAIAAGLAATLAQVHRAGLVHRQVTPENVLVRPDGSPCLVDFGLAARTGPEPGTADGRTDLFALGGLLAEMLAGRGPEVPAALTALVGRLLAEDPDDRPRDADAVHRDLLRLAGPDPVPADPAGTAPDADPDPVPEAVLPPGLVGRDEPWRILTDRLARARAGRGGAALVVGPPGTGTTRLAEELIGYARRTGAVVLSARCRPGGTAPLAPLRVCVEDHLSRIDRADARSAAESQARLETAAVADGPLLRALSPALGRALLAPQPGDTPDPEGEQRFLDAVAGFFVRLATPTSPVVIHLDDVEDCDPATLRVLQRLATTIASSRVLLVLSGACEPAVDHLALALRTALVTRVELGPLRPDEVEALIGAELGGRPADPRILEATLARTRGNPLLVGMFLRAVLDAGLLHPSWDGWRLDVDALEGLDLPADLTDLLVRRLHDLGPDARRVLTVAAVLGAEFGTDPLEGVCAAVHSLDPARVSEALAAGAAHQLVEPTADGFAFVHQRVRDTLLAGLDSQRRHALHAAVADHLAGAAGEGSDPARIFALARHLSAAGPFADPAQTLDALVVAGVTAVDEYCPAEAMAFLADAEAVAGSARLPIPADLHAAIGAAALLVGDHAVADDRLGRAVALATDPARRVQLVRRQVRARLLQWRGREAQELVDTALAGLGSPQPTGVRLVLSIVAWGVATLVLRLLPAGRRPVRADRRRDAELVAALAAAGATAAAAAEASPLTIAGYYARGLRVGCRLGRNGDHAATLGGAAWAAGSAGMRRAARRLAAASAAAVPDGDPVAAADAAFLAAGALDLTRPVGDDSGLLMERVVEQHRRWLDVANYLTGLAYRASVLTLQGHVAEADAVVARMRARTADDGRLLATTSALVAVHAAALAGRTDEARRRLAAVETFLTTVPASAVHRFDVAHAELLIAVERGEHGAAVDGAGVPVAGPDAAGLDAAGFDTAGFDRAAEVLAAGGPSPEWSRPVARAAWLYLAWGRLAQVDEARDDADRARRLDEAALAVRLLARGSAGPLMGAYHEAAVARLDLVSGRTGDAVRRLARLRGTVTALDAPLLEFEVARTSARAYRELGRPAQARRQAELARMLAARHGWPHRERAVGAEFALDAPAPPAGGRPRSGPPARLASVVAAQSGIARDLASRRTPSPGGPTAAVMIDIDRIGVVNDRHGHAVGDEVIREVAARLTAVLREGDVICRYDGGVFAVLLPGAADDQAEVVARRLHDVVGERPVGTAAGPLRVSVSVGLAAPSSDDDPQALLRRADDALDDAKRTGRDRVAVRG